MTADSDPILDRLSEKVIVGCGFSGSGFKHSPATGKMLAAFALGQQNNLEEGFRADRYKLARFS